MSLETELKETVRAAVLEVLREQMGGAAAPSPNQLPEPLALSVEEVARLAGVKPRAVREWIRAGALRATRPGGGRTYLVLRCDLTAFLAGAPPAPDLNLKPARIPSPSAEAARILGSLSQHSSR